MNDENQPVTKKDLDKKLEGYPTTEVMKKSIRNSTNEVLEMMTTMMRQQEDFKLELKQYCGVLIEDAEERFLKTGYDKISVNSDKLQSHDDRIGKLEVAVF